MGLENRAKLSPYWARIMERADEILTEQIENLQKQTVDPDFCLSERDKILMAGKQESIKGYKAVRETIRNNEWGARFWALDTVLGREPTTVFRKG